MEVLALRQRLAETGSDPALLAAIKAGMGVVAQALHVYGPREIVFSFNGGKDSCVVLHLIRAVLADTALALVHGPDPSLDARVPVIYFEARDQFPEVLAFMEAQADKYGCKVRNVGPFKSGMTTLIEEGVRAVFMGTRRGDPDGGALEHFTPTSLNWPPMMRVCPVLGWSYSQVWGFLRGAGLETCVLYGAGYTSLGSTKDSRPNPLLAIEGEDGGEVKAYRPAWELEDAAAERLGRSSNK